MYIMSRYIIKSMNLESQNNLQFGMEGVTNNRYSNITVQMYKCSNKLDHTGSKQAHGIH
jgi:hypothetical protein